MPSAESVSRAALSCPSPPSIEHKIGPGRDIARAGVIHGAGDGFHRLRHGGGDGLHHAVAWILGHQPLEAAGEHFAHHAVIVAGGDVLGPDVELAVLVLAESFLAGDDHGADGVGSLDMAVVVDLDAARHARQLKNVRQRLEQFLLRGRFRKLSRQRFARVSQRVVDEVLLLAALGRGDLDAIAALRRQRLGQKRALTEILRNQDQARARLVVIELR